MSDPVEWFTNPEHETIMGLDAQLADILRSEFGIGDLEVDCGVEGKGPYTYHFRLKNVPRNQMGFVCNRAMDLLSSWTPYRYEVQCL
jgi:hypothetical protein